MGKTPIVGRARPELSVASESPRAISPPLHARTPAGYAGSMTIRSLGISLVFVAGCAVGGASARFVVPPASAQQAATLPRWEYVCIEGDHDIGMIQAKANTLGAQAWEMAGSLNPSLSSATWCFKRPKM